MARNQEKAQSMLFRFRESKAIEMGLVNRGDKRPAIASTCTNLRQCERYRGELLKDVSRKVSKIQDKNLSDYEVRDLNDEINRLMREKWHWETQIINLGGANYRRGAPKMVNADGVEIPGQRGYKYFGRAKELPGVKALFQQVEDEAKEHHRLKNQKESIFSRQTPAYYGNDGDEDAELLEVERQAEAEGWDDQWLNLCETLDLPEDTPAPPCPKADWVTFGANRSAETEVGEESAATGGKRKAVDSQDNDDSAKKSKADGILAKGNRIFTIFSEQELRGPKIPTLEQTEAAILQRQKAELLQEYNM